MKFFKPAAVAIIAIIFLLPALAAGAMPVGEALPVFEDREYLDSIPGNELIEKLTFRSCPAALDEWR